MAVTSPRALQPVAAAALFVGATLALAPAAAAQDKPSTPTATAPAASTPSGSANPAAFTYDVVSIKLFKDNGPGTDRSVNQTDDGFAYHGLPLIQLLINAFPTFTNDQLVGVPDWAGGMMMGSETYDVVGKMDEETAIALKKLSRDQQADARRSMMLKVLEDRCKLKFHKETRELPIYNLVIAKNGPKFKVTPAGTQEQWRGGMGEITQDNLEMVQLSRMLSGYARRVVVDKTGLTGKYTLSLKWNPLADQNVSQWFLDRYPDFKNRPGLVDAVQEQLGLKLESAKGPVDVYVIDHIEKPSPD